MVSWSNILLTFVHTDVCSASAEAEINVNILSVFGTQTPRVHRITGFWIVFIGSARHQPPSEAALLSSGSAYGLGP